MKALLPVKKRYDPRQLAVLQRQMASRNSFSLSVTELWRAWGGVGARGGGGWGEGERDGVCESKGVGVRAYLKSGGLAL